jgi:hypothetical protein
MLKCPVCRLVVGSPEALADHQAVAHRSLRPILVFQGRVVGAGGVLVLSATDSQDWRVLNTDAVEVNGRRLDVSDLAAELASRTRETALVRLVGSDGYAPEFRIQFDLADQVSLRAVDEHLTTCLPVSGLSRLAIDTFLRATQNLPGATRYLDGIAQYLYGVLALDAPSESGIPSERFVEKFERSTHALEGFATATAATIRGLIALRFNHATSVELSVDRPLLSAFALFLEDALSGHTPDLPSGLAAASSTEALADRGMSEVLRAFHEVANSRGLRDGDELQAEHSDLLPEDRLKIALLATECHLATGRHDRAVDLARALANRPEAERWATTVIRRASGRAG